jgi:hypothetical protein
VKALTYRAGCYEPGCDWTAEGPTSDREAEKHVKTTKHGTWVSGVPS